MVLLDTTPTAAFTRLTQDLGLADGELAGALMVTPRTLDRWRIGASFPQHAARARLVGLLALADHLDDTFTTHDAGRVWLHAPHPALGLLTPADLLRLGHIERVEHALVALDAGIFI